MRALASVAAAAVALVGLFVLLRPDDDQGTTVAPTTLSTTTATSTAAPPATTAPFRPAPNLVRVVRITVRGGQVVGGIKRPKLAQGVRAVIVVRADVADEVHLHGYDLSRAVGPGEPARIAFKATLPGRFEIELENRGLEIAEIVVEP